MNWKKGCCVLAAALLLFATGCSNNTPASAPSVSSVPQKVEAEPVEDYECQSEKVEALLQPDGTMKVREYYTFSCKKNKKMTLFGHTIPKSDRYEISDIVVEQGGGKKFTQLEDFDDTRPEKSYAIKETEKGYQIETYYYIENQSIGIVISYTVKGAMEFHNDIAELNWEFLPKSAAYDVQVFTGMVILPAGAERKEVKAWTHGQEIPYALTIDSGELVTLSIEELTAYTPVDIRLTAPLSLFPQAQNTSGKNGYQEILTEENDPEKDPAYVARENKKDKIIQVGAPLLVVVCGGLILFGNSRRKAGQR